MKLVCSYKGSGISRKLGIKIFGTLSKKSSIKVQMKCIFLLLNLKEQLKSGRSLFTVS